MKLLHTKRLKDGCLNVLIKLEPTEAFPVQPVKEDAHYRLGHPVDDVVGGHIIQDARQVYWCSVRQEWVDAA